MTKILVELRSEDFAAGDDGDFVKNFVGNIVRNVLCCHDAHSKGVLVFTQFALLEDRFLVRHVEHDVVACQVVVVHVAGIPGKVGRNHSVESAAKKQVHLFELAVLNRREVAHLFGERQ